MNTTSESAAVIPETLLEAVRHFSNLDVCHEYLVRLKWPTGVVTCPKCGGDHVGHIKTRRMFQCKAKDCRKQFSAKVGTIFEDSPLGLDKWFVAVWSIAAAKNGISSHEVGRALGVTQKTAWFMLHRIRLAMQTKSFHKMGGIVEGDETMVGGKAKFMHKSRREEVIKGRGGIGKAIVQGLLERDGEVRCVVVENQKRGTLQKFVRDNVARGSAVFTDALASYVGLELDYIHQMIDHAKSYVDGLVHTNGMENFWSLLKRCFKGTYVHVAPVHLFRYLDEETFRFNKRKGTDGTRFVDAMAGVVGRRLQYSELTSSP